MLRRWLEAVGQGVLVVILVSLVPGWAVAYLAHIQSVWTYPILLGAVASAIMAILFLALMAIQRLPPKRLIPTVNNIEDCVHVWLNRFQVGIKNFPLETCYFRVLTTMDSGTKIFVGRVRGDHSEYLQARADMSAPTPEELAAFDAFSEEDRQRVIVSAQLELARRRVGYSGLQVPPQAYYIFKRVPINESLTEHQFMEIMYEVEAAVHAVTAVTILEIQKCKRSNSQPIATAVRQLPQ